MLTRNAGAGLDMPRQTAIEPYQHGRDAVNSDNNQLDYLVRQLCPVNNEQASSVLDESAKTAFAQQIIDLPRLDDEPTGQPAARRARTPLRRRALRPALVALGMLLVATGGLTVMLPLGVGAPAIAGWEATPRPAPPELLARVTEACTPPTSAEAGAELSGFMAEDPPLVGVDVRGNAAAAVFADAEQYLICNLVDEDDSGWSFSASQYDRFRGVGPNTNGGDAISADAQFGWSYGQSTITTLVGRVSEEVDTVTVERSDGLMVDTTLDNGMFIAWWPTSHDLESAYAYDADAVLLGSDDTAIRGGFTAIEPAQPVAGPTFIEPAEAAIAVAHDTFGGEGWTVRQTVVIHEDNTMRDLRLRMVDAEGGCRWIAANGRLVDGQLVWQAGPVAPDIARCD